MTILMHLARAADWQRGKETGRYAPASLASEGFVHCSLPHQVCGAANRYFAGASDLWLLTIDGAALDVQVKLEDTVGTGELFPHVYGAIPVEAVRAAQPFPPRRGGLFAFDDDSIQVGALDHVYLTVSDLGRARRFYDPVMDCLGFRIGDRSIGGDSHVHYFNRVMQISLRPARSSAPHDPYAPGLHHLCLQVANRGMVELLTERLGGLGVAATPPALYPEYAVDYFATFFQDPDGMRFEVVARRARRDEIAARFGELRPVLNPLEELYARPAPAG